MTIVLVGLALASAFFAAQSEILWSVAIMLIGAYLLFSSMRTRTT